MNKFKSIPPIASINGTNLQDLLDQKIRLLDAVREAKEWLKQAEPNARDWQIENPFQNYANARSEHARRLGALDELMAVVEKEAESILGEMDGRRQRGVRYAMTPAPKDVPHL